MLLKLAQLNLIFSINIHNIVYKLPFMRKKNQKKSIVLLHVFEIKYCNGLITEAEWR
jgi:hypothetical protein